MKFNKVLKRSLIFIVKPFIIPVLIIVMLLILVSSIADILYVAFNNEEKINLKEELEYYDAENEYEKEEMKSFFSSVWEFVEKIFGIGEISNETDWPVERTL